MSVLKRQVILSLAASSTIVHSRLLLKLILILVLIRRRVVIVSAFALLGRQGHIRSLCHADIRPELLQRRVVPRRKLTTSAAAIWRLYCHPHLSLLTVILIDLLLLNQRVMVPVRRLMDRKHLDSAMVEIRWRLTAHFCGFFWSLMLIVVYGVALSGNMLDQILLHLMLRIRFQ